MAALSACLSQGPDMVGRQLMSGGGGGDSGHAGVDSMCTCLPTHVLGSDLEHTMVTACLWVAFALSVLILMYYMWHTYLGTCGWEEVYVVTIEMLKTVMEVFYETSTPATILQFNGVSISWLRYAEWLLTCPVILIHLSNLTGTGHYNKRTMRLIVSDLGTIVCGISAALSKGPAKVVFFLFGCCYGASTFITAASVYISAYKEVPSGECKLLVKLCAWVFFGSWLLFPLLFLMGPESFGHLSPWGSIIAHTFADLLSKNLWGLLAHHLRNKIQEHSLSEERAAAGEAVQPAAGKITSTSMPLTPKASMAAAKAAASTGAIAMITATPARTLSGIPTKTSATLLRGQSLSLTGSADCSTAWEGHVGGAGPVLRVLLGLPTTEDAVTVLEQFQVQFAALPFPACEALPATGPTALLSAAANAATFGGADAVLLHISYLIQGGPGVASGAGLVGTLKELGVKVYAFGCDVDGPPEDVADAATLLDGWIEGPTWAAPLNNRQLAAVLLMMAAARNGSRAPSAQGISHPASPRGINLSVHGTGPILRSRSNAASFCTSPVPGVPSRSSFDATNAHWPLDRTISSAAAGSTHLNIATTPRGPQTTVAGATTTTTAADAPGAGTGAATSAAGLSMSETEILTQLMHEISRLKKELSDRQ